MDDNCAPENEPELGDFEDLGAEDIDDRLRRMANLVAQPSWLEGTHEGAWARSLPFIQAELLRLANEALASLSIQTKRRNAAECKAIASALVAYDEGRELRSLAIKFAHRRQRQLAESPPVRQEKSGEVICIGK